jgi:hypothetical protein
MHMQVCAKAGVEPSEVDYIEAHGTGTVAGDGQELGALEEWYGRTGGRTAENPLLIGSVKSNMGHCEGCSGLAGVSLPRVSHIRRCAMPLSCHSVIAPGKHLAAFYCHFYRDVHVSQNAGSSMLIINVCVFVSDSSDQGALVI